MVRRVWSNCFTVRPNGQFQPFVGRDGKLYCRHDQIQIRRQFREIQFDRLHRQNQWHHPTHCNVESLLEEVIRKEKYPKNSDLKKNLFGYLQVKSGGEEGTVGSANALVERSLPKLKLPSRGFRRWPSQSWSAKKTRYLGSQSQRGPTLSQHCPTNGAQLFRGAVLYKRVL